MQQQGLAARIGRVGVWHGGLGRVPAAVARQAAAEIEQLGYGALWFGETPATESMSQAALLLAATERITVATGIANIWVRDASATHVAAQTLAEAYDGRFLLGLGASHAPIVGARGHTFAKPLAAMREYLDAMDEAPYAGPVADPPPARVLAALGPKMLELARDRAAGAHPYFVTPEHTARAREILGAGPLLAPEQAVLLESDPATARSLAREHHTRLYLQLPNYTSNLRRLGFGDEDFADGGSDRLVDAVVAWGDADAIRRRVQEHHDAGADHVALQPLVADRGLGLEQLRELAPVLL
ncbi:putative F420-dependent oxidoreductase [Streptomyces sp. 2333.5]|uniref:LLM class F420-dependent oxidoreductase n=1 Tax=unclassified Streptomyces TaxID=2593676 RepID=UPI0008959806|nr:MULTISPECIES: LLM class F420-dependent oxidoreductase [unclassified Streptomyces]PJJ04642.1 putative F420-dependent oxidoreductase [Streptomyces sp. 2333.5]SEE56800.1 probable F420-dependent oxidoreductase, MSMEG_4141 family [Streptomyces sp. 2314.4]SEE83836.1 probable F420-dependent oxidoreductase, MSMEG_4141 family [Streptomyces sp. 2112.2]SOE10997.1 probable F420-dependent oxidoreductase, MSMEG_4141 family [Streptomyces sp. 2323.1]